MKQPKELQKPKKGKKLHNYKAKYKWYQRSHPIGDAVDNAIMDLIAPKKYKLKRYEKRKKQKYRLDIDDKGWRTRRRSSGYKDFQE